MLWGEKNTHTHKRLHPEYPELQNLECNLFSVIIYLLYVDCSNDVLRCANAEHWTLDVLACPSFIYCNAVVIGQEDTLVLEMYFDHQ